MVGKCANPVCPVPFHYFHEGKLFVIELGRVTRGEPDSQFVATSAHLGYLWLCPQCCQSMTVSLEEGTAKVVPMGYAQQRAAAGGTPRAA